MSTKKPKAHRFAEFFPLMEGEEFAGLVEDIKEHGLLEPIVLLDGKILDGRNRYRACLEAGTEPRFVEFKGKHGPLHYVASKNFHRRGLNPTQRSVIALALLPELEKEAAERQRANLKQGTSRRRGSATSGATGVRSSEEVASLIGAGARTVQAVKRVAREAPELVSAMMEGKLSADAAEKEVRARRIQNMTERGKRAQAEKRRKEEPKQVKAYLDALKEFRRRAGVSVETLRTGDASPEAIRFIAKRHEEVRAVMQKVEEVING